MQFFLVCVLLLAVAPAKIIGSDDAAPQNGADKVKRDILLGDQYTFYETVLLANTNVIGQRVGFSVVFGGNFTSGNACIAIDGTFPLNPIFNVSDFGVSRNSSYDIRALGISTTVSVFNSTSYICGILPNNGTFWPIYRLDVPLDLVSTGTVATTAVATTAVPTTGVPTTAAPPSTTAVPTTGVPTTAVATTGVPTTGVLTTGIPTTGVPTTGVPTTGVPTTGLANDTYTTTSNSTTGGSESSSYLFESPRDRVVIIVVSMVVGGIVFLLSGSVIFLTMSKRNGYGAVIELHKIS